MKKMSFLSRLKEEGKLEFVEQSLAMQKAYFEKSESNLISAKILFENSRFEEAVSLAYYSMYNCVLSLFFRIGLKCENHSAGIVLLKKVFGI